MANIHSPFLPVRSALKELSTSLHRQEDILDSVYQMFVIAQTYMAQQQRAPGRPPLRLIPPRTPNNSPLEQEGGSPSGDSPLGNIDIGQIMALLQSPL